MRRCLKGVGDPLAENRAALHRAPCYAAVHDRPDRRYGTLRQIDAARIARRRGMLALRLAATEAGSRGSLARGPLSALVIFSLNFCLKTS